MTSLMASTIPEGQVVELGPPRREVDGQHAEQPAELAPSGRVDDLRAASDRIGEAMSRTGAAANRVDSASARAGSQLLTVRTELSNVQDVDVTEGVMELQIQQVAYEATLQALTKVLPPSLVSFLR